MMIPLYILTIYILLIAIAGAFYSELPKRKRNLSFLYLSLSLPAQLFALQYLLGSIGIFAFAAFKLGSNYWLMGMSGAAALLFVINLWRSYKSTQILDNILPGDKYGSLSKFIMGALFPLYKPGKSKTSRLAHIAYGDTGKRNQLDIYTPKEPSSSPMPVLIHIHGGAWVIGRKKQQALPLIHHMASKGWLVVDINYRLGPRNRMPVMITDVLRAINWVKSNIAEYGGDPEFIALTGGSAGGNLTALAALTHDNPDFKPGFENADCSVNAAVPVYGVYDFLDRTGAMAISQAEVEAFLTRLVMPGPAETHRDVWDAVSPIGNIRADAPPMFIIHGRHDVLAPYVGAEIFVEALKKTSNNEVIFASLPSGQHAYDLVNSPPVPAHVHAVERFLNKVRSEKSA